MNDYSGLERIRQAKLRGNNSICLRSFICISFLFEQLPVRLVRFSNKKVSIDINIKLMEGWVEEYFPSGRILEWPVVVYHSIPFRVDEVDT